MFYVTFCWSLVGLCSSFVSKAHLISYVVVGWLHGSQRNFSDAVGQSGAMANYLTVGALPRTPLGQLPVPQTSKLVKRGLVLYSTVIHALHALYRRGSGAWHLRRDHVTSLLRDRHWLPVKQRVEYKLCMLVHRCLYGDAPSYLADLITPSAAATVRPGLRSAASSSVAVPRTTSSLGDRSFAAAGQRAWNKLPPPLRCVSSPAAFKRQLETFLYNHAFNLHC